MERVVVLLIAAWLLAPGTAPIEGSSLNTFEDKTLGWGGDYLGEAPLLRKKRYLNFPDGSTLNVVLCLTVSPFMPGNWYTFGLTAGMGFPLPNSTAALVDVAPFPILRRRDRRDLYSRIEELIDSHGLDGRSCLYRLLCEMSRRPERQKGSFLEELLRILFTSPKASEAALLAEMGDHLNYDEANGAGRREGEEGSCSSYYPQCPFPLLDDFTAIDSRVPFDSR